MEFSELMHEERKAQRMTLRLLSAKTGIDFYMLSDFDAGRLSPCASDRNRISSALGIYHHEHSPQQKEYQKYEFCKAVGCMALIANKCEAETLCKNNCIKTAKDFHKWLDKNGFKIAKDRKG